MGIGLGFALSLLRAIDALRYLNIGIAISTSKTPINGNVMIMFSGEIGIAPPAFTTNFGNR
jgi:hypothetical protein